ncbi:Hpt domain-containing protein [Granulicella sp. dw_53]|uniref:Hpt domain-containing protein n=1 Tax=Granulicella sp. dw_53 TaxID=2719792 RepID=UPI001BD1CF68|nr:Hpt domain-containing protein [Granulicella sp. dw_53]
MTPDAAAETAALIAELWQRHLPALLQRLDTLDRIAASAAATPLSSEDRNEGLGISHKLAGSLGMYGYHHGTEVAMQLELLFRSDPSVDQDRLGPLTKELREAIFPTR